MCEYDIAVYGCGHTRFLRLRLPCPAGLCSGHKECFAGNDQVSRTCPVEAPPFCKDCFEKEVINIDDDYLRAESSLSINLHRFVRFYITIYGRALADDILRIRDRLVKKREADQELLEMEFYGPTRRIPDGDLAFLYSRPDRRAQYSHSECNRAFRASENWDSSQNGDGNDEIEDLSDDFEAGDSELGSLFNDRSEEAEYCRLQRHRPSDERFDAWVEDVLEYEWEEGEIPDLTEPTPSVIERYLDPESHQASFL